MLSKALSKANAAVQLDNAQNYEAARESYLEACDLLHQVLARTNGEDDRRKLEAIRQTYTSRIEELDGLLPMGSQDDKALPARPDSLNQYDVHMDQASDGTNSQAAHILSRERYNTKTPDLSSRYTPSPSIGTDQLPLQSSFSKSPMRRNFEGNALSIPRTEEPIIPPPLSPRHPASSPKPGSPESIVRQDFSVPHDRLGAPSGWRGHRRVASHESASWLDPIEESGGSAASSVHSRSSSLGIRRKHLRHISGDTEAEFDAALDAAVEAAYDEGFDPMEPADMGYDMDGDGNDLDVLTNARRKVEMAKERVRQTEREAAIELARERERHRQLSLSQESQTFNGDFFDANDSDEEEERMLEEMTRGGYLMEDFTFNQPSKSRSNVPRDSIGSITEMAPPPISKESPPSLPPPPQALPQLPQGRPPSATGLKIETSKIGQPPNIPLPPISTTAQRQALSATSTRPGPFSMRAPSSPGREISPSDTTAPQSPTNMQAFASTRPPLRENFSSSSLRTMKTRQVSVSHMDDSDMSPNTPLSHQLSNSVLPRPPAVPALPTPLIGTFHEKMAGGFGGIHLFDSDFHSPTARSDIPMPLEPCPSDGMLRPFWLMRALYQTLAHPRGGYLSNRLFVPRDAWKVKGVKLRAVEDKISQVDSNDADAVLEEMQSFESILESVQNALTRKLGAEKDGEATPAVPRSSSSKGSGVNLSSAYGSKSSSGGGTAPTIPEKDVLSPGGSIPSLPMTAHPSSRPAKRDVMSANLARLFDAAQTVDQIARQVEDPGLRHADKTQVGLELCTRHAAEFFGFYICRFVLADLALLLDKFVKRGSEWVLN
ncbi:hypothetical protein F4775DRAFT_585101 [Biscogniauxia sp. FL1348]|nr:hypothetical protein F4775DRAFT_585101 [Biscogniauxia sp. FL1348]